MIKIGDKVVCRFYNTPERRFYGKYFVAEVTDIRYKQIFTKEKEFFVIPDDILKFPLWVDRRNIKRILK